MELAQSEGGTDTLNEKVVKLHEELSSATQKVEQAKKETDQTMQQLILTKVWVYIVLLLLALTFPKIDGFGRSSSRK